MTNDGSKPFDRPTKQYQVGEVVHFVSYGTPGGEFKSQCRAATITEVLPMPSGSSDICLSLMVANPTGLFFNEKVYRDEGSFSGGTWHSMYVCGD